MTSDWPGGLIELWAVTVTCELRPWMITSARMAAITRSSDMRKPQSEAEWCHDAFQRGGHTHAEVLANAEWCGDYADRQAARRRKPGFVVSQPSPWWQGQRR